MCSSDLQGTQCVFGNQLNGHGKGSMEAKNKSTEVLTAVIFMWNGGRGERKKGRRFNRFPDTGSGPMQNVTQLTPLATISAAGTMSHPR